jgi:hypothetical protein
MLLALILVIARRWVVLVLALLVVLLLLLVVLMLLLLLLLMLLLFFLILLKKDLINVALDLKGQQLGYFGLQAVFLGENGAQLEGIVPLVHHYVLLAAPA